MWNLKKHQDFSFFKSSSSARKSLILSSYYINLGTISWIYSILKQTYCDSSKHVGVQLPVQFSMTHSGEKAKMLGIQVQFFLLQKSIL